MSLETPWYKRAFGRRYLDLYAHRDRAEAERGVALLARCAELDGARLLDAACGAGRYLSALRGRGARVFGFDLSSDLLEHAAGIAPVARADMRKIPFRADSFHGAVSMFTSFGYFSEAAENRSVLDEIGRVLRPDGWFLLDTLNPEATLAVLVKRGERKSGGFTIRETRSFDEERKILSKEVLLLQNDEPVDQWVENLMLYYPDELVEILGLAGFRVTERFGDYQGGPHAPDSPRLILFCHRCEG